MRLPVSRCQLKLYHIAVIRTPGLVVSSSCCLHLADDTVTTPQPATITWTPRHDAAERVGEGGFERVIRKRVQERVNGAVCVAEDGEELEQVHLVGGKRNGRVEDGVDLHNTYNT